MTDELTLSRGADVGEPLTVALDVDSDGDLCIAVGDSHVFLTPTQIKRLAGVLASVLGVVMLPAERA